MCIFQGAVLVGPFMFLIYLNYLYNVRFNVQLNGFLEMIRPLHIMFIILKLKYLSEISIFVE